MSAGGPTAVVFDLDGTLVDSMDRFLDVYRAAIRSLGGPRVRSDDIVAAFHVGSTRDLLAHFLGRGVSDAELETFYEHAADAAASIPAFPGISDLLTTLSAAGVKLRLFTGATRRTTQLLLAKLRPRCVLPSRRGRR